MCKNKEEDTIIRSSGTVPLLQMDESPTSRRIRMKKGVEQAKTSCRSVQQVDQLYGFDDADI